LAASRFQVKDKNFLQIKNTPLSLRRPSRILAGQFEEGEGVGIKPVITNHHLALIGNMRGHSGDEFQIIHLLKFCAVFAILIANFTFSLINRKPFEG